MKTYLSLAVAAACLAGALPSLAQCPAGMATSDPGPEPVNVIMKYTWKLTEVKPTALKAALEKLPFVAKTYFDEKNPNHMLIKFKGRCDQIALLESAAKDAGVPGYVVSHAHVTIVLKTQPGADVKGAIEAIGKVPGAMYAKVSGTAGLELHADLGLLNIDEVQAAAAPFKCTAQVNQSYEYVRFKVLEGKLDAFKAAAANLKGVMIVRRDGDDVVGMWLNKSAVKADQVEKLEGFKLKKA